MQEQNQRTSPWLIAWRVIFTFALIGCIVFIFSNSLQIADVSEGASGRVLGILQGILRHLGLPGAADRLTMHIVRKLAHFCEYLLEGFLLMLCLRVYTRRQSMSRKPSSRYSQKCASLRTMCMVSRSAAPGSPRCRRMPCSIPSTRPLAPSDTSAICRELEKMNTMQPMRAKVKITRHAMSHGEVR